MSNSAPGLRNRGEPNQYPVVMIHGIDDSSRVFNRMRTALGELEIDSHAVDLDPSDGSIGMAEMAEQVAAFVTNLLPADAPFDLIGFSMGGLVGRYYLRCCEGWRRVRRFISLSAPHRGTVTAYFRWNKGARQMRPGSDFLTQLSLDETRTERVEWTSIWTPFDLMIVPACSSRIERGQNHRLPVLLHPWMLTNKRVIKLIAEILTR